MKRKKREKFLSYITINPYAHTFFECKDGVIKKLSFPKFNKKNFYISYLATKDLIITKLDISRNIPEEDLRDVIELKIYEELELDQTIEYKIDFVEIPTPLHEKERKFQVFVSEPQIIKETFEPITKKIPYIDSIVPAPMLFAPLYHQNILDSQEVHLFIYFQSDDAFLSIYAQGNLLYAKSLKYSFKDIAQRLTELKGKEVSVDEVVKNIANYGVKLPDLDELQFYMQVFSEIFMHINDILIYAKRANNIEVIDKIFIGSEIGFIKGIEEYSQTYLAKEAYDFQFDYGISSNEPYIEDLHYLLALIAIDIDKNHAPYPNFTLFKRPPPFFKRPSGELVLATAAGLILALAYPAYNLFMTYKYRYDTAILQKSYPAIHAQRVALESNIKHLKKEIADMQKKIANKTQELKRREKILQAIYDKKVNYIMKAATLADLTQDLAKNKIKTIAIENNQSLFDFNVTATDEKRITQFIKYIYDNKYDRYDIAIEDINKTDPNSTVYCSDIKVVVK